MAHPDVVEASVVGVPDERWGERPLAAVVAARGRRRRLRRAARLPRRARRALAAAGAVGASSTRCRRRRSASSTRRCCASGTPTASSTSRLWREPLQHPYLRRRRRRRGRPTPCPGTGRPRRRRRALCSASSRAAGLGQRAEVRVQDAVALVGDERLPSGVVRTVTRAPSASRNSRSGRSAIGTTSTGIANAVPERRHQLRLVDDDDQPAARLRDDLLPQVRAAAALDQVQRRRHLVGAVDRDVQDTGGRRAWSAGCRRPSASASLASEVGTPSDVASGVPSGEPLADAADRPHRGAARAEARPACRCDVPVDGGLAGGPLRRRPRVEIGHRGSRTVGSGALAVASDGR